MNCRYTPYIQKKKNSYWPKAEREACIFLLYRGGMYLIHSRHSRNMPIIGYFSSE